MPLPASVRSAASFSCVLKMLHRDCGTESSTCLNGAPVKVIMCTLWVRGVFGICQSSVSAVLRQRLSICHDAFRLPSWRPPRRLLCDGLKSLVRTRELHLFPKLSRMSLPTQAPDPRLQSRPVRAPSSRRVDSGF